MAQNRNESFLMQEALKDLREMDQVLNEWKDEQMFKLKQAEEGEIGALNKQI